MPDARSGIGIRRRQCRARLGARRAYPGACARCPGSTIHAVSARTQEIADAAARSVRRRQGLWRLAGDGARSRGRHRRGDGEGARTPRHRPRRARSRQARLLRMAAGARPGRGARNWPQRRARRARMSRSACRARMRRPCAMPRSWCARARSGGRSTCAWSRRPLAGAPSRRRTTPISRIAATARRWRPSPAATRSPRSRQWSAPIPRSARAARSCSIRSTITGTGETVERTCADHMLITRPACRRLRLERRDHRRRSRSPLRVRTARHRRARSRSPATIPAAISARELDGCSQRRWRAAARTRRSPD